VATNRCQKQVRLIFPIVYNDLPCFGYLAGLIFRLKSGVALGCKPRPALIFFLVPTRSALSYTQVFFKVEKNPISQTSRFFKLVSLSKNPSRFFEKIGFLSWCRSQKKSDFLKKSDF
jgi:hypothetical protein